MELPLVAVVTRRSHLSDQGEGLSVQFGVLGSSLESLETQSLFNAWIDVECVGVTAIDQVSDFVVAFVSVKEDCREIAIQEGFHLKQQMTEPNYDGIFSSQFGYLKLVLRLSVVGH